MELKTAVVTGASSGIGAATARHLAREGYRVLCVARRADRIQALADEIGGMAVPCDITDEDQVQTLAQTVGDQLDLLVNNAGGAVGLEPVGEADLDAWETMYRVNVLGTAQVTKTLLPALEAARGTIVFVTSTAADGGYEGGAGYCGAKAAERAIVETMRLELFDKPVRITEICPGMVHTDEFSLTRFHGDQAKADKVYAGVAEPLVADDVADAITWMATRPRHVNIDRMTIRPRAQAAQFKVFRES
ncbi:SDR family oxidoreductase [Luteococcus sp. Sow4_B9]|uniref:SDR family oxidoreductase n=1 Tax=Luteococcus sp. Sow4_B9 TaxID=3438792 RepID=UPI003F9E6D14